ncbi:MAG TPA: DUF998 domain-containing protein [Pseudolysinimonas sp.]|jgi:hypothetical protein|nr:DUF998 domain-containing protein [Pseudolysinimonas sp.]
MPDIVSPVVLLAVAVLFAALVVLHVARTGLNPVTDEVSRYGITRFRAGYTTAAVAAAVAGGGCALLLAQGGRGGTIAVVLLWIFAAARVLIVFFPMDGPDAAPTGRGRTHNLLAVVAFATVTAAAFFAAGSLGGAGEHGIATVSTVCGIVMAVGSGGIVLSRPVVVLRRSFGALERLIYLGFIVWFAAVGVALV